MVVAAGDAIVRWDPSALEDGMSTTVPVVLMDRPKGSVTAQPRDVAAGEVIRAAQGAERKLIAGVDVFDVYEGVGIPDGSKSIAVAVRLQPVERTLTDTEIEAVSAKIVAEVAKKTGASLRA